MRNCFAAIALLGISLHATAQAQEIPAAEETPTEPSEPDNLKKLGSQLLMELFARVTSDRKKSAAVPVDQPAAEADPDSGAVEPVQAADPPQ